MSIEETKTISVENGKTFETIKREISPDVELGIQHYRDKLADELLNESRLIALSTENQANITEIRKHLLANDPDYK